jgi:hypothetical protein
VVAGQVARLVDDGELRARIAAAGLETVTGRTWDDEIDAVHAALVRGPEAFSLP